MVSGKVHHQTTGGSVSNWSITRASIDFKGRSECGSSLLMLADKIQAYLDAIIKVLVIEHKNYILSTTNKIRVLKH